MRLRVVASLALLVAVVGSAVAAPPQPTSPIGGGAVDTARPTFTWVHDRGGGGDDEEGGQAVAIVRYEVVIVTDGIGTVAEAPGDATSATSTVDLPPGRELRWVVRSTDAAGNTEESRGRRRASFVIASALSPPQITAGPPALTNLRTASVSWSGAAGSAVWKVVDADGRIAASGESPDASGQASWGPLADGTYTVSVALRSILGTEGPSAGRVFRIDATPPAAPTFTATAPASGIQTNARFSWTGVEAGARASWRLTTSRGTGLAGPTDSTSGAATVGPLAPGAYLFQVRQTDVAGNIAAWRVHAFTITAPPAPVVTRSAVPTVPVTGAPTPVPVSPPVTIAAPTIAAPGLRALPARRAAALLPRMGALVSGRRPVLRWTPRRKAVRYNVQIFATSADGSLNKVRSVFPKASRYRLPARRALTPGACYVWRVWPFFGKSFARTPVGVSHFCIAGAPPS
jgi:hypothetical protein